jgi:hypothetical protein
MNVPILFIVFNRPDTTERVFKAIAMAKPVKLYIAADGARENKQGEKGLCEQTRKIAQNIDWDCEVKKLFQKENLGCGRAVSEAISWFFENEEMGIILEDDCLPHPTFFDFCENMLIKYKDNDKISIISGNNFQKDRKRGDFSYYFSNIATMWGWATWAQNWKDFKLNVNELDKNLVFEEIRKRFPEEKFSNFWLKIYEQMKKFEIDTWDYQFYFSQIAKGKVSINPNVNLVSNIGFNNGGTHTFDKQNPAANIPVQAMEFPLKHPTEILANHEADKFIFDNYLLRKECLLKRTIKKIRRLILNKNSKNIITVKIMGGLGNQMFQYAFGFALAKRKKANLSFDTSWFYKMDSRFFELDQLCISKNNIRQKLFLTLAKIPKIGRLLAPLLGYISRKTTPSSNYFEGFFQDEKHFADCRDEIRKEFQFREKLQAFEGNAVAVHIRRGDYVHPKSPFLVCTPFYYEKAISYIQSKVENPVFYVFSEDIEWCKKNVKIREPHFYIGSSGKPSSYDMQLMSLCKHNIISNSSYSWWAAWLNQNPEKIIVAPDRWFADGTQTDIYTDNMVRISTNEESK